MRVYLAKSGQKLIAVTSWTEEDGETELDVSKVDDPANEILDKFADDDGANNQATDNLIDSAIKEATQE